MNAVPQNVSQPPLGTEAGADWRYERKFIAERLSLAEVLALARRHSAAFHEIYPTRAVNNVYLDSPSLHDYYDHLGGAAHRVKTRIRWYGPLRGPNDQPHLEQKIKHGQVNTKHAYLLPSFCLNGSIDRTALARALENAGLPSLVRSRLHHMRPVLINRYQRHYLKSADGLFRLTVDSELEFHNPNAGALHATAVSRNLVVLELKFRVPHAEFFGAVSNGFRFRLSRFSKYMLGIESLASV